MLNGSAQNESGCGESIPAALEDPESEECQRRKQRKCRTQQTIEGAAETDFHAMRS